MTSPSEPSARERMNRKHWDGVLDPQNLDAGGSAARLSIREELRHWDTLEQRWAMNRLEPLDGRWTLEIGGGLGVGAAALALRGARVILLDISLERARAAREALRRAGLDGKIEIIVARAEALPFRSGSLDRATTKSVLIHTDLPAVAREVWRALRPGGKAVILEPLDAHPVMEAYRLWLAPKAWRSITRYWNRREAREFAAPFLEKGKVRLRFFYLLGFVSAAFTYGRFRQPWLRRFCEGLFSPLDALILHLAPFLRWKCWFVGLEALRGDDAAPKTRE